MTDPVDTGAGSGRAADTTVPYLVVWTSPQAHVAPPRCQAWAARVGAQALVVGPADAGQVRALLAGGGYAGAVIEITDLSRDRRVAAAVTAAGTSVVGVSRGALSDPGAVGQACTTVMAGRGTGGFVWALWHLHALRTHPPRTLRYGRHIAQCGDLRVPRSQPPQAIVVLVHGGFWRHEWRRDLMDGLAVDLTARGYATWNIEYRRLGPSGGGWPQSRDDVVDAVTSLTGMPDAPARVDHTVLLGHSAGAHLALHAAAELRRRGRGPALIVALAGVFDPTAAAHSGVGWGSIEAFLGGEPGDAPDVYRDASAAASLPLGVSQILVHGAADEHVPPQQTDDHARRVRDAGDECETVLDDAADHFAVIDPTTPVWASTAAAIARIVPPRAPPSAR